ncbi:DNA-binding transcriptional MerR regulator [Bradyrhizobium sp. LB1.3]
MDADTRETGHETDDQDDVVAALQQTIARLQARVAELEQPAPHWLPLKRAASVCGLNYETVRVWAERGLIDAHREGGRWIISLTSLKARQARLFGRH